MLWLICVIIVGVGVVCDEVWVDLVWYIFSLWYRCVRLVCVVGGLLGYGGNSCHSCVVFSIFKVESCVSLLF